MHDIGGILRSMRKAAGLSQMRLADKVGVSYQQIQKYEKNASKLSVPRLIQLSEIFGVPVTAFFSAEQLGAHELQLAGAALTAEEAKALQLLRRMPMKSMRASVIRLMEDLVNIKEKS